MAAAKGTDTDALKKSMDDLNESLQKIGQHIYSQTGGGPSGEGGAPEGEPAGTHAGGKGEEEVVDAEYKEV